MAGRVKEALRRREVRKGGTGGRTARRGWRARAGKIHDHKAQTRVGRERWEGTRGRRQGGREATGKGRGGMRTREARSRRRNGMRRRRRVEEWSNRVHE